MGIRGLLVSCPPFHTRIFGTVLALVLFVSGCISLNKDAGLAAEESLALNLAEQVVHAPYLANEQLQARLAVLKFLGLPYEEMSSLFGDVERQISECMHQMEHTYSPTRLQAETEKDVVLADLRVRFAACIGAERADYLASLDAVVAATASPIERSRAISEFAIAELGCSETVLAPSDSVVRERVARAIREDHQFMHEICRLEDGVGWSIPPDVAKCGHEH